MATIYIDGQRLVEHAEKNLAPVFARIDEIALANQKRVLDAFREHRLTEEFFAERTGYGIDDIGRQTIDKIFATVFGAEAAAVRLQLVSGTHALACALFGNLKPGERLVCLTGKPYDTMEKVIGIKGDEPGSLRSMGIDYLEIDFIEQATVSDLEGALVPPTAVAYIQKSCGYNYGRRSLSAREVQALTQRVKLARPDCKVLVDNCYGEFVEVREPTMGDADLIAGSLIKNPGGGLALTGGYIAGRKACVDAALNRLTAPGIGGHLGLTYNQNRLLLQGLFTAPAVVANAVKGAALFADVFSRLGFECSPKPEDERSDIIQGIKFGDPGLLTSFLKAVQMHSPVNSHVQPEPSDMPGYEDKVIMAGGSFIEGSTIEFSADGPLRPPYAAFVQGALTYYHVKCALIGIIEAGQTEAMPFIRH
jgi:cystathionine beta-lyase family protein involved in aluminum resistance